MTSISATDRSLSSRGGLSLPDEAISSTVAEDCLPLRSSPKRLAITKWRDSKLGTDKVRANQNNPILNAFQINPCRR